jgi:hypothetical protein
MVPLLADTSCTHCERASHAVNSRHTSPPTPCRHDASLECSGCGALVFGAELCPDASAHEGRTATAPPPSHRNTARTYNTDWPRDAYGNALVTFTNRHTGNSVTLACFSPYHDPETQVTLRFCPRDPKLPGDTVEIISGLSPNQFKERAAHLAGRDETEHERKFFTVQFFRDYYFAGMHQERKRLSRAERRSRIRERHDGPECSGSECRKSHRNRGRGD